MKEITWPFIDAEIHPTPPAAEINERLPKKIQEELAEVAKARAAAAVAKLKVDHVFGARGIDTAEGKEADEAAREQAKKYDVDLETGRRRRAMAAAVGGGKLGQFFHTVKSAQEVKAYIGANNCGGAVVYGSFSPTSMNPSPGVYVKDISLEAAVWSCRAINDWSYDTFKGNFDIFAPAAGLPIWYSVEESIKELERIAKMGGLRPAVIPTHIDHRHLNHPDYEPFWAAANEIGIPLAIHIASHGRDPRPFSNPGGAAPNFLMQAIGAVEPVALLTCAGVFERYPNIKLNLVECEIGWLAWLMEFLDRVTIWHQHWVNPHLPNPPSYYIKRNVVCSFMEDTVGLSLVPITGTDPIVWGSDFPHHEGTWPYSKGMLEKSWEKTNLTEAELRNITHDNLARMFNLDVKEVCEVTV